MKKELGTSSFDFSPEVNFVRYLQSIRQYNMLTPEEEFDIANKYIKTKDKSFAYKLVTSHLRLVAKIVVSYKGYGLPVAEMISEGNMGLLHAVEKFDPSKGFRFSTYALWWIKAFVQRYILNSWSLVKIGTTSAQKKLFFNLRKIKNNMGLNDDRELSGDIIGHIATSLDVSARDVVDMNNRMKAHDGSLNTVINSDGSSDSEWMDFIADNKPNQEDVFAHVEVAAQRKKLFNQALGCLNRREKDILFKRRMQEKSMTLDDLSKAYNISKERVRQIELNSIKKIQKRLDIVVA